MLKVETFLKKEIDKKDFAKYIRRFLFAAITLHLDDKDKLYDNWIKEGRFWLNEFAETLDPQLDD